MEPWMAPMLCASADDVPAGDYALEPKLDGWRFLVHSTGRGCIAIAGRNGSDHSGKVPYIETEIAASLPPDTCVDGELIGGDWGDVQSVMTTGGGPHVPTQKKGGLQYVVFDVLRCNGQDTRGLRWEERRAILDSATFAGDYVRTTDVFEATPRAYQVAVATGFEGVVCKQRDSLYTNGRSSAWVKIKAEWTCEAKVVAWEFGTGSNAKRLGALHVELLDENDQPIKGPNGRPVRTKVGGGFVDAVRAEFENVVLPTKGTILDQYPPGWQDAIIEVKHNGVLHSGKVRHPTFVRKRDDKTPTPKPRRTAPAPRTPAAGSWVRNYGAMGDTKLLDCISELELGIGDATHRVTQKSGDVQHNLARAKEAARSKGLIP